jgi:hypothetical protein
VTCDFQPASEALARRLEKTIPWAFVYSLNESWSHVEMCLMPELAKKQETRILTRILVLAERTTSWNMCLMTQLANQEIDILAILGVGSHR